MKNQNIFFTFLCIFSSFNIFSFSNKFERNENICSHTVKVEKFRVDNDEKEQSYTTTSDCSWTINIKKLKMIYKEYDEANRVNQIIDFEINKYWEDEELYTLFVRNYEDSFIVTVWKDRSLIAYTMSDYYYLMYENLNIEFIE